MKIFVYGTLKPGEVNYQRYCQGKVIDASPAFTFGQLFALPVGYPALTQGPGHVYGVVLTFADDRILADLDQLEDYDPDRPISDNEYQRELREVFRLDGPSLGQVWTYFMTPEKVQSLGGILLTEGFWGNRPSEI